MTLYSNLLHETVTAVCRGASENNSRVPSPSSPSSTSSSTSTGRRRRWAVQVSPHPFVPSPPHAPWWSRPTAAASAHAPLSPSCCTCRRRHFPAPTDSVLSFFVHAGLFFLHFLPLHRSARALSAVFWRLRARFVAFLDLWQRARRLRRSRRLFATSSCSSGASRAHAAAARSSSSSSSSSSSRHALPARAHPRSERQQRVRVALDGRGSDRRGGRRVARASGGVSTRYSLWLCAHARAIATPSLAARAPAMRRQEWRSERRLRVQMRCRRDACGCCRACARAISCVVSVRRVDARPGTYVYTPRSVIREHVCQCTRSL